MNEDYDVYRVLRAKRQRDGEKRRESANDIFREAQQLAAQAGLTLMQHTDAHYSLSNAPNGWLVNVYPGNRRLYHDRKRPKAPFLRLERNWSLVEVVNAAIAAMKDTQDLADAIEKEVEAATEASSEDQTRVRAFKLWESAGRPEGDGKEFWHQAEDQ
jgi:hypothetical protein